MTSFGSKSFGGTDFSVRGRGAAATRRLDSPLRGHRACGSHCLHVCSGPNKTLFASTGPNSRGREHRRSGQAWVPGRINVGRGHRCDGTPGFRSFGTLGRGVTKVPPYAYGYGDRLGSRVDPLGLCAGHVHLLAGFGASGFLGFGGAVDGFDDVIRFVVSDHGVEGSHESSSHGDIGLGLESADVFEGSLSDGLLSGVVETEGDGGLADRPSEGFGAGLGDGTGLGSTGGFGGVGGQSDPELEGVGIGEPPEVTDFGGDDAGPDLIDPRHGFQESGEGIELLGAVGEDDVHSELLALTFEQTDLFDEVAKGQLVAFFEERGVGEEPSVGRSAVELGPGEVGGMEHGFHELLVSAQDAAELTPVSPELPQMSGFRIGDVSDGTLVSSQSVGDVGGAFDVILSMLSASTGQLGGVGDIDAIDTGAIGIDEPFEKGTGFDGHPGGTGQS